VIRSRRSAPSALRHEPPRSRSSDRELPVEAATAAPASSDIPGLWQWQGSSRLTERIEAERVPADLLRLSASDEGAHYRAAQLGHDLVAVGVPGKVGID